MLAARSSWPLTATAAALPLHELDRLALGDLHETAGHDNRAYRGQATRRIPQAPQDPARRSILPLVGRDRPRLARGMREPWTTTARKTALEAPKMAKTAPRTAQDGSKMAQQMVSQDPESNSMAWSWISLLP
eukprot:7411431-Pyramimonas_sp.AAC.1